MNEKAKTLYRAQDGRCAMCGRTKAAAELALSRIRPAEDSGIGNLQLLCRRCSSRKGGYDPAGLLAGLRNLLSYTISTIPFLMKK